MKNGKMTADGKNIINQIDDNTKLIFRMDVGGDAHKMPKYGYTSPTNHINIEIQTLNAAGDWKTKWDYHIMLDNLGQVENKFATGVWTKY